MTPERYVRVVELFQLASDLDPRSRADFLVQACNADDDLRQEVESMLTVDEQSRRFLNESPNDIAAGVFDRSPDSALQPAQIGDYRILGVLGEGGMGMVYEAEQDQPRRIVALKVIKPEMAVPELLRRFEQEVQALGRLQHPGIAQVYEAGTTYGRFGPQPYFAMELIRGDSLLRYAEKHNLSTRQRLALMAEVCEAVHHAHQRGIIHRDLKPANILVDETGQPKILDLGVARVTNTDAEATRQTDVGQIVGTLAYMSPEQVLADPMDLDIRSDVYALGVILFELLAGILPYKIGPQLHESIRTICEEDPTPLSAVSRAYRGDIETIVGTALEKDRARRYSSAEKMASDIWHYLRDEPIAARRPSAAYRLQKFTRRHKVLAMALAAIFLVLIGGIIVSTRAATRARRAEQAANAVNDFLRNDLLAQASANMQARPGIKADRDLKVRTVLDRAAVRISGRFKTQPLVEASIRQTMANTYGDLGLYPDGQRQAERALDLRRRVLGERHRDTLASMHDLAVLYWEQGKYAEAEQLYTKTLDGRRRVLGKTHPDMLNSMHYLAIAYLDQGKYAQAETPFRLVLEARRRLLGENPPDTLMVLEDLASLYSGQGKYERAQSLYLRVLDAQYRVLGEEHPDTLLTIHNLAVLYRDQGRYSMAEPLFTKELQVQRRILGEEHAYTVGTTYSLAKLYLVQRKYDLAEPLYMKVLRIERGVMNSEGVWWLAIGDLAFLYFDQGKYQQSEALLRKALNDPREIKTDAWLRYSYQSLLGANLAGQKECAEAEPLLLSGYQGMLNQEAIIPPWGRSALERGGSRIVLLYEAWGRPQKAAERRQKLQLPSTASRDR